MRESNNYSKKEYKSKLTTDSKVTNKISKPAVETKSVKKVAPKKIYKTTKVLLNGRVGPGFSYKVEKIYKPETTFEIIEERGEWSKNSEGLYIKNEFLK